MLDFKNYILFKEQEPPAGGGGAPPIGGGGAPPPDIPGGMGGPPLPTGGDPPGGLGLGSPPAAPGGEAGEQIPPKEIKSKTVWDLLEKILSSGQPQKTDYSNNKGAEVPPKKEYKSLRT